MVLIREYRESDAESVGKLIRDTYGEFNLAFVPPGGRSAFLGPFQHAQSSDEAHRKAISSAIRASIVLVAEEDGSTLGVLRGKREKLQSLFVNGAFHRKGIGRQLVERFERTCVGRGAEVIRLMSTLHAVPFYQAMGYRRSTGVRRMKSFEGDGLLYQPMKKVLRNR